MTAKRWIVGGVVVLLVSAGGAAWALRGDRPEETAKVDAAAAKVDPAAARRSVNQALRALYNEDCSGFRQLSADRDVADERCEAFTAMLDGLPFKFDIDLGKVSVEGNSAVVRGQLTVHGLDDDLDIYTMEYRALNVDCEWKYEGAEELSHSKGR